MFVVSRVPLLTGLAISFMTAAVTPVLLLYPPIYMRTVLKFDPVLVQNALTIATLMMALGKCHWRVADRQVRAGEDIRILRLLAWSSLRIFYLPESNRAPNISASGMLWSASSEA